MTRAICVCERHSKVPEHNVRDRLEARKTEKEYSARPTVYTANLTDNATLAEALQHATVQTQSENCTRSLFFGNPSSQVQNGFQSRAMMSREHPACRSAKQPKSTWLNNGKKAARLGGLQHCKKRISPTWTARNCKGTRWRYGAVQANSNFTLSSGVMSTSPG